MKEQIILAMPAKNASKTIAQSIQSVLNQKGLKRELIVVIGNDNSTDTTKDILATFLPHPRIKVVPISVGTAYGARNYLNNYIRTQFPNCVLIGRLDADDTLKSSTTIVEIETLYDSIGFDVLLAGNQQKKNNTILEWENRATAELLDDAYVLKRLKEMKEGNSKAELPSCNTFIKPTIMVDYPEKVSAEDHWFTIALLLQKRQLKIHIAPELLYCIYSLDGFQTTTNNKNDEFTNSRIELYQYYKTALSK